MQSEQARDVVQEGRLARIRLQQGHPKPGKQERQDHPRKARTGAHVDHADLARRQVGNEQRALLHVAFPRLRAGHGRQVDPLVPAVQLGQIQIERILL